MTGLLVSWTVPAAALLLAVAGPPTVVGGVIALLLGVDLPLVGLAARRVLAGGCLLLT